MTEVNPEESDHLWLALTRLTSRRIKVQEIWAAMGVSKPYYYEMRKTGEHLRPDRLIAAANAFGVNPVDLLVEFSPEVTVGDAVEFVEKRRAEAAEFLEAQGAHPWKKTMKGGSETAVRRVQRRAGESRKKSSKLAIQPDTRPL